jgi:subtilisin family serine protease
MPGGTTMKEPHVILRSRLTTARAAFSGRSLESSLDDTAVTAFTIDVDDIDHGRVSALRREPGVEAVAPAIPVKLIAPVETADVVQPAVPGTAWGVKAVGAETSPWTGQGVVVAVLDTGIDAAHPAFVGVTVIQEDFTGEGNGDTHGHGTHCAGTILGRVTEGVRIGVAPGVTTALIGKVLGENGGSSAQIVNAIQWAIQKGANVISMSLGIDFPGLQARLQNVQGYPPELATSLALEGYRANVILFERLASFVKTFGSLTQPAILVAAAGNESRTDQDPKFKIAVSPPAVSDGFISVAALGESPQGLSVAPFSNTGASVSGPGVAIVSAKVGGGLRAMSGTSMATPHVAGVAALWAEKLERRGPLLASQWTAQLLANAVTTPLRPGFDSVDVGAGLVRAPEQ